MVELAAELEAEPNVAGANGEEWLVQRPTGHNAYMGKKFQGKAARGAEAVGDFGKEDVEHEETDEPGVDGDMPTELVEAKKEAYAMHFRAKQKMAEVKKMRQYYTRRRTTVMSAAGLWLRRSALPPATIVARVPQGWQSSPACVATARRHARRRSRSHRLLWTGAVRSTRP